MGGAPRIVDVGRHAVLVEVDSLAEATAVARHLREPALGGVDDVVGALRTVLVRGSGSVDVLRAAVLGRLGSPRDAAAGADPASVVTIPVDYDGDDLGAVAAQCALAVDEVIALHAGATYTVACCGFAPGFAYLSGLPPELVLPRRATPRARVPAGSVAIAGELSAVYPTTSPGGWHLLGRTTIGLFDVAGRPPALLTPGTIVHFLPAAAT